MTNGMEPYIKDEMAMRNESTVKVKVQRIGNVEFEDPPGAGVLLTDEINKHALGSDKALKLACACMAENLDCPMYQPDSDGFNSANGCLVNCDNAKQANCWESYWRWRAAR